MDNKKVASKKASSIDKYQKWLNVYKYFKLKKLVGTSVGAPFTSGDETKMQKAKARSEKYRKLARPALIARARRRQSSKGKGKKKGGAGGALSKL